MSRWNIMGNIAIKIGKWISSALVLFRNIEEIHIAVLLGIPHYELVLAPESTELIHVCYLNSLFDQKTLYAGIV